MIGRIRKAVFPVGGLGTRLLPATKAVPKEMLTIIDRPVIQYAVDEARAAGIDHFVFVTGRNNRAIEDHFRIPAELASALTERGQADTLARIEAGFPQAGETSFTRQHAPLGLGHAIWCARDLIGDEPFAVLLPDVVLRGEPGGLAQILETYSLTGGNVVGITECRPDQASRYGIVALGEKISDDAFRIAAMVEKPKAGTAPSNLKLNGRYILQPRIFEHLARHDVGTGGEIQLTDALLRLAEEQPLFGRRFHGRSFDCGSKEGFLAANIAFALESAELAPIVLHEMDIFLRKPTVSTDPKDRPVQSK